MAAKRRSVRRPLRLPEAAAAVGLSVSTLRRHIRSGRLRAERVRGKYGPEYRITYAALAALGLPVRRLPPRPAASPTPDRIWRDALTAVARLAAALEPLPAELTALRREVRRLRQTLAGRDGSLGARG